MPSSIVACKVEIALHAHMLLLVPPSKEKSRKVSYNDSEEELLNAILDDG